MDFIKKNPISSSFGLAGLSALLFVIALATKATLLSLGLGLIAGAAALYLAFLGSKIETADAKLVKIAFGGAAFAVLLSVLSPALTGGSFSLPGISSGPSETDLSKWQKENEAFFAKHMAAGHAVSISLTDMTALDPKTQKVLEKVSLHGGRINTQTGKWTFITDEQRKAEEEAAKAAQNTPAPAPAPNTPAPTKTPTKKK